MHNWAQLPAYSMEVLDWKLWAVPDPGLPKEGGVCWPRVVDAKHLKTCRTVPQQAACNILKCLFLSSVAKGADFVDLRIQLQTEKGMQTRSVGGNGNDARNPISRSPKTAVNQQCYLKCPACTVSAQWKDAVRCGLLRRSCFKSWSCFSGYQHPSLKCDKFHDCTVDGKRELPQKINVWQSTYFIWVAVQELEVSYKIKVRAQL